MRRFLAFLALLLPLGASAQPAPQADLQLVLAVDASGSVSSDRFVLQRHGYAEAFRSPRVQEAIAAGASQAILVTMIQWTGPQMQEDVIPWTLVHDRASAEALAAAIDRAPRRLHGGGTSISGAIDHAMKRLAAAPGAAARRVIDISGDGRNNRGRPVDEARDEAVARGVTINGLPILTIEPDLDEHYRSQVIGGPGAFLIAIDSYDQFAEAIQRKLVTEISARATGRLAGR